MENLEPLTDEQFTTFVNDYNNIIENKDSESILYYILYFIFNNNLNNIYYDIINENYDELLLPVKL